MPTDKTYNQLAKFSVFFYNMAL